MKIWKLIVLAKRRCEIVERLKNVLPEESVETGTRCLEQSRDYILENWGATWLRLIHKDEVIGSSTERHVNHVLSSIESWL
ncbi:MAG: hypothetical protein ACI4D9_05975 [Lachnospiraceae bacterium]